MRIYIGPYVKWYGPYQIADTISRIFRLSEKNRDRFTDWLTDIEWVSTLANRIHKERKVKVKIHDYDTWNVDSTLALIIYPLLQKMNEDKQGAPYINPEDVPETLRPTKDASDETDWVDDTHFERWNYVLDEMIWAFGQAATDDSFEWDNDISDAERQELSDRQQKAFELFGKYFKALWT